MESPVVLDKPPEYHSKGTQDNDKGFPFEEEEGVEGGGAWSELAARHPDIAARLRARPSGWPRKRRSSHTSQPTSDGDDPISGLGEHFNRFPFDDIPPEFREHFPERWGHRFVPQERSGPEQHPPPHQPQPQSPQNKTQNTISTQTEENSSPGAGAPAQQDFEPSGSLPQYGLRNTVDLGQKTPADPSLVDAENERNQRSMSAPPDNRVPTPIQQSMGNMMSGNPPPPPSHERDHHEHNAQSNVRHIPIFVEGRDEPIINKAHPEPTANFAEPKPQYVPPPTEREQYFEREPGMGFHHPPNFSRAFGTPFGKGFRQGPQPFAPQKAYQQNSAPQGRSQSPKPQVPPQQQYTQKVPVQHEHAPPQQYQQPQQQHYQQPQQQYQQPQQQHNQQPQQHHQQQRQQSPPPQQRQQSPPPPHQQSPPPPQQQHTNDPITKILSIQKDVLDLMTEVENFVGTKAEKRYIYLDEMLTRNLIKLDDIETQGKENIRQARREAIKCIEKCIAVLEAKADGKIPTTPQPGNVNMQLTSNGQAESAASDRASEPAENSETKEDTSENNKQAEEKPAPPEIVMETTDGAKGTADDAKESIDDAKGTPKKTKKVVKKRDKSKDKQEGAESEPTKADKGEATEKSSVANTQEGDSKPVDGAQPMETNASAVSSQ